MQQSGSTEVRTKVANLQREFDELFSGLLEQLRRQEISSDTYQKLMLEVCGRRDLAQSLVPAMARVNRTEKAEWLLRRHIGQRRYTAQVYKLLPGASQAPHQHHNLLSTHLVLTGQVHLREYQRIRKDGTDNLILELVRDEIIGIGSLFQASEWSNNVHWFGAVDEPALMFSIDARGYECSTFHSDDVESFGRRYLDPTDFDCNGYSIGVGLAEDIAKERFEDKPLSDFPMPVAATNNHTRRRKSA